MEQRSDDFKPKYGEFPCPSCGRIFKVESSVRRHIRYFCGKKPPPITGYTKYGEDDYECTKCKKHYKLFCTLKRHILHECDKPPKIECPIVGCNYKAKMRDRMLNHCRMVHKMDM
ncbi:unnamed protein product [Acanthoscelides obtectus]|uniref:C2H2-type domain-containing protein n=1 Tax=Acanthoscelides obtectus TaxID=200917 RepID=A0A9P0P042_ACAOB|nr:unnamed protein product [Acanthoscelides obtectus]CAK1669695.1 hypothetical protein AOBTE_LOCUS27179 [Acanthoscelides obtectus]